MYRGGQQNQAKMNGKNKQARDWHRLVHRLDEIVQALLLPQVCVHSCPRPYPLYACLSSFLLLLWAIRASTCSLRKDSGL